MIARSLSFETFTVEREIPATPERVFRAFGDRREKTQMLGPSTEDAPQESTEVGEFDFRVGGHEQFEFVQEDGQQMRYDAIYCDIVPNQRIVYCYEMYANDVRLSVSVASIQFFEVPSSAILLWTEQGAFFDGLTTSVEREGGTSWMMDNLADYFESERTRLCGGV